MARAARAGTSLQEHLRAMLVDTAGRVSVDDALTRASAGVTATGALVDAAAIIAARDLDHR